MSELPHAKFRAEINALLAEVYTEPGIELWWNSANKTLHGHRPVDLLTHARGRYYLRALVHRLVEGEL